MTKGAGRRYLVELGGAILAYAVVLLVAVTLVNNTDVGSGWRVPLALAPMVPAMFMVVAFARYMGRVDELQRRVQLEALAFAFGGTALLTFGYGFLQLFAGFPQVNWFAVWPIMAMLWMAGKARADRRYR